MVICPGCGEFLAQEVVDDALLWGLHRFVRHTDAFTKVIVGLIAAGMVSTVQKYLRGRG
jgi:hypothetical protein